MLCCAVLCCAVLCCAVLCCAVLCCAVLCCAVLCCVYFFDLILIYLAVMSQQLSSEVAGLRVNDSIVIRLLFSQFVYVKMAALKTN
ncbi:hypothetical protein XF_0391 [Xylella fastidiosa 9a5c]|uniref:Secreted protein n=1 Tax=Xylella fastidiosa (strain 9a5c) TaxID=160492 RepID=Q9PGB1_XYLFA|nr:hypothetical protein XF_0391 [Xylella fastidiosa 9a5c]